MDQLTIKEETLEKIEHLEKMAKRIFEEIKEIKPKVKPKNFISLRGIIKGVKITEQDIEKSKRSLFKYSA